MDEDPLQHQIYFLTFIEPLEMIFSPYTETCEVILGYLKIGWGDIEDMKSPVISTFVSKSHVCKM